MQEANDAEQSDLSNAEIARYSRHLILDEVGMSGQKLKAAKVLCVGTGGLGSPTLMYLAAAGVGRIGIIDFDVVDVSQTFSAKSFTAQPQLESPRWNLHGPVCWTSTHTFS